MSDCLKIKSFIEELEVFAEQKLNYPAEIGELLQIVMDTGMTKEFDDLIFQAKFLVRTREIMKRIGPGTDGFEKLSSEFQSSIKDADSIFNMIVDRTPLSSARKLTNTFNIAETESFNRLMKLFFDLSWIKNWQIDGKSLPYETNFTAKSGHHTKADEEKSEPLIRIQKSAFSIAILFILLLFIDPPVTVIGWILSLGIAVFLVYIIVQVVVLKRT